MASITAAKTSDERGVEVQRALVLHRLELRVDGEVFAGLHGLGQQVSHVERLGEDPIAEFERAGVAGRHLRRVGDGDAGGVSAEVHAPAQEPEDQRAEDARDGAARPDGEEDREAEEDREVQHDQRDAQQIVRRPDTSLEAERQPGADDEDADLEGDEGDHAEVLAREQAPARDRLGEKHRDRSRLEERRQERGGPDQGEEQTECVGDAGREDQLEPADDIIAVMGLLGDGDRAEEEGQLPVDDVHPGGVGALRPALGHGGAGQAFAHLVGGTQGQVHGGSAEAEDDSQEADAEHQPEQARGQRLAKGVPDEPADDEESGGEVHDS